MYLFLKKVNIIFNFKPPQKKTKMDSAFEELITEKIRYERDQYFMDSTVENKARLEALNDVWYDYLDVKSKTIKIQNTKI